MYYYGSPKGNTPPPTHTNKKLRSNEGLNSRSFLSGVTDHITTLPSTTEDAHQDIPLACKRGARPAANTRYSHFKTVRAVATPAAAKSSTPPRTALKTSKNRWQARIRHNSPFRRLGKIEAKRAHIYIHDTGTHYTCVLFAVAASQLFF